MAIQTKFRNNHQAGYLARDIARNLNRGTAIQAKIMTVLNQIRESAGVNSLKKIDSNVVQAYVSTLQDRVSSGELSIKTAADYISALNDVIRYSNENLGGDIQTISAKEFNLSRGGIQYQDRTVSQEVHQVFKEYLSQQNDIRAQALSHSVELQREFGLRLRESLSVKQSTIQQALKIGELQLTQQDGTKNSQSRIMPVTTQEQRQALQSALDFMKSNNLKSLIPTSTRIEQYRYAENIKTEFNRVSDGKMDYHGERHYFAQSMLQQGYSRQEVSEILGHHREEILKYYVGGVIFHLKLTQFLHEN